jgi:NAD+ synthase
MYDFDARRVKEDVVEWIREFFEENGKDCKAVVAISGGKDSSVVAALCVEALGRDRVFGVLLPNGEQADIDASRKLVAHLQIDHVTLNIRTAFDGILDEMRTQMTAEPSTQTITNLPARLRMAATYAVAQSKNGRVANTCNLSEDWVGYNTRYGDGAGDFSPLCRLTVQEVRAVGEVLGLPHDLVYKVPIDGLTPLTDEENLGFTYDALDRYIRTGVCEDPEVKANIDRRHKINLFKLNLMPAFEYAGSIKAE